jgi:hypothetical protein
MSMSIDALRADPLAALAADHLRASTAALKSRLHRLVAMTEGALSGNRAPPPDVEAFKARASATDTIRRFTDRLGEQAAPWLDEAATAVAAAWALGTDGQPAARASLLSSAAHALTVVREAVDGVFSSATERDVTTRRIPPLFDPEFLDALPSLDAPRIARSLIGHRVARAHLEAVEEPLSEALSRYAGRLYSWGIGQLEDSADAERPAGDGSSAPEHAELAGLTKVIDAMQ